MAADERADEEEAPPPEERARKRRFRQLRRLRRKPRMGPRRRRLPFDLSRALFILPNAFTVSSIFCGLYAILLATSQRDDGGISLYHAGLAIFFAGFFDMFDGRVARLTRTQSDFGVQMDSLADVISFGVAPAVLVYKWALAPLGLLGMFVSFSFAACGAIRLARFNVLAARGEGSSRWFMGLPIPMAASMVVALVIAHHFTIGFEVRAHYSVLGLVAVLCYLMVSNVRYRTFKDFRPTPKNAPILIAIFATGFGITVFIHPSVAIVVFLGAYIFIGLLNEVLFFKKRRANEAT
jgi:CDP-diacylglycerol--serine O-phosphatidyltransferase